MDKIRESKAPAIINFSYQVAPPLTWETWMIDERAKSIQADIERTELLLGHVYSEDYQILKDEYIVQGDCTYHHLIARRVDE